MKKIIFMIMISLFTVSLISSEDIHNIEDDELLEVCQEPYSKCTNRCERVDDNDKKEVCDDKCDFLYSKCLDKLDSQ